MAKGRTKSKLSLQQRRGKAFKLFTRGYSDAEVARQLKVTRQTVNNYRRKYEERLTAQARNNPTLLREVLENTMRSLQELDAIREDAWKHLEDRKAVEVFDCAHCSETNEVVLWHEVSDQARNQYLGVLLKAQDQRAKLFGVIGVKADMLIAVAQVKMMQEKILEYLARELPATEKAKLEAFLVRELGEMDTSLAGELDVVDAQVISDTDEAA